MAAKIISQILKIFKAQSKENVPNMGDKLNFKQKINYKVEPRSVNLYAKIGGVRFTKQNSNVHFNPARLQ